MTGESWCAFVPASADSRRDRRDGVCGCRRRHRQQSRRRRARACGSQSAGGTPSTVTADALPTVQINGIVWDQAVVGNVVLRGGQVHLARPGGGGRNERDAAQQPPGVRHHGRATSSRRSRRRSTRRCARSRRRPTAPASTSSATSRPSTVRRATASPPSICPAGPFSTFKPELQRSDLRRRGDERHGVSHRHLRPHVGKRPRRRPPRSHAPGRSCVGPRARGTPGSRRWSSRPTAPRWSSAATSRRSTAAQPRVRLAMVSAADASLLLPFQTNNVIRNAGLDASIMSLKSDGAGSFYAPATCSATAAIWRAASDPRWATGDLIWVNDCHGDEYDVQPMGGRRVPPPGHPHYCGSWRNGFPQSDPWTFYRGHRGDERARPDHARGLNNGYFDFGGNPHLGCCTGSPASTPARSAAPRRDPGRSTATPSTSSTAASSPASTTRGNRVWCASRSRRSRPTRGAPAVEHGLAATAISLTGGSVRVSWRSTTTVTASS